MATATKKAAAARPAPKTPAEIPAETTAAHKSEYDALLTLTAIEPHPKNIRHSAIADQELVDSITAQGLLQPLVVAPHPDKSGMFRLIAGHRRKDGLEKAGYTHAPAIIRHDLTAEADQVAAMLVENGRRADLTPIEEAEGYGQLRFDFGWKPGDIAKMAGHSVDTINKRLRLLKLDDKVKTKLDDGQLNLEDAITIAELPKADQVSLSKSAGTGTFKWDLGRIKDRIKKTAATEKTIAQLLEAKIPEKTLPAGTRSTWALNHADDGMTPLSATFSRQHEDHPGCLAFIVDKDHNGAKDIAYVCTDAPKHDEQLDETRREKRRAEEAEERAAEELERAQQLAAQLRVDAVRDSIKPGTKLDQALAGLLRVLTHRMLLEDIDNSTRAGIYFEALAIPEDEQWGVERLWTDEDRDRFRAHVDKHLHGTPAALLAAFTAAAAAYVEADQWYGNLSQQLETAVTAKTIRPREDLQTFRLWLDLTEQAGHQPTPVDVEIRAQITENTAAS